MRELRQRLDTGATSLVVAPRGEASSGMVLVRTQASLVSPGTERMLVTFARSSLLDKARQQPHRVRDVAHKALSDGIGTTAGAVARKLASPVRLGYAQAGVVEEAGGGTAPPPGTAVATNGPHADLALCSARMVVPVPRTGGTTMDAEEAACASIGAIALQSVRLLGTSVGERVVVTGLGLVGLLATQVLRASGCRVLGLDTNPDRVALAEALGIDGFVVQAGVDVVSAARRWAAPNPGVDAVLVAASTSSSDPIHQAAEMCRVHGRIVLVGVTGLDLRRDLFYEKELTFQVSSSYGPGRYDPSYEDDGVDYPFGHVRWTAGRNMAAFLDLVADGAVDVKSLITHRFPFEQAPKAYDALADDPTVLAIALEYPEPDEPGAADLDLRIVRRRPPPKVARGRPRLGIVGAGNFTRATLLPALDDVPAEVAVIASRTGSSAALAAERFDVAASTTDLDEVFDSPDVDAVVITTRHDTHAALATRSIRAGKHVYCEKPLALTHAELDGLEAALDEHPDAVLALGVNRRHAGLTRDLLTRLEATTGPRHVLITVNAGRLPDDHWLLDPDVGGGRLVGEGIHFIDLACAIVGDVATDIAAMPLGASPHDGFSALLSFEDGSQATILYTSSASPRVPKERVEVHADGASVTIDNWRRMVEAGKLTSPLARVGQDKGHADSLRHFVDAINGRGDPVDATTVLEVSGLALRGRDALSERGRPR